MGSLHPKDPSLGALLLLTIDDNKSNLLGDLMGCAMEPASSTNCAVRSRDTSSIRFTGREFMSALNSCGPQEGGDYVADHVRF